MVLICVFDIETVPDVALLEQVHGYSGDPLSICQQAFDAQEKKTSSSFLPLCFHRIVSIASVIAEDSCKFTKVGCFAKAASLEEREEAALRDFCTFLNRKNPRLVSFNGRGFDLPLVALRALKYNLPLSAYYEVDNPMAGKTKWDNYRYRYSEKFHLDLLDLLGGGQARGLSLDSVCKMAGIMGKHEVSGEQVFSLILDKGDLAAVDFYCQSDVINTYWLFLKLELSRGTLSLEAYLENLTTLKDGLPPDAPYKQPLISSLDMELQRYKGQPCG